MRSKTQSAYNQKHTLYLKTAHAHIDRLPYVRASVYECEYASYESGYKLLSYTQQSPGVVCINNQFRLRVHKRCIHPVCANSVHTHKVHCVHQTKTSVTYKCTLCMNIHYSVVHTGSRPHSLVRESYVLHTLCQQAVV
jgi:hypothetical protein